MKEILNYQQLNQLLQERNIQFNNELLLIENKIIENDDNYGLGFNSRTLINIEFKNCKFKKLNIDNCNLMNVTFDNCIFEESNFFKSKFDNNSIYNSFFDEDTNFINCEFDNLKSKNNKFKNKVLTRCRFINTDLSNQEDLFIIDGMNTIYWDNLEFIGCQIDTNTINNISNKINNIYLSNASTLLSLKETSELSRLNIIASIFTHNNDKLLINDIIAPYLPKDKWKKRIYSYLKNDPVYIVDNDEFISVSKIKDIDLTLSYPTNTNSISKASAYRLDKNYDNRKNLIFSK